MEKYIMKLRELTELNDLIKKDGYVKVDGSYPRIDEYGNIDPLGYRLIVAVADGGFSVFSSPHEYQEMIDRNGWSRSIKCGIRPDILWTPFEKLLLYMEAGTTWAYFKSNGVLHCKICGEADKKHTASCNYYHLVLDCQERDQDYERLRNVE
jgi:hypothetical protein